MLILPIFVTSVPADMSSAEDEYQDILSAKKSFRNRLLLHAYCFYYAS